MLKCIIWKDNLTVVKAVELSLKKDNFGGIYEKDTQASWK